MRSFVIQRVLHQTATDCNRLQQTATDCNTLHRTAVHCNTLHRTAAHYTALQQPATHGNTATLTHTTTPCNTLQHTGTFKNTVSSDACALCAPGFFSGLGDGAAGATNCKACPHASQAPAGSALRSACMCNAGYTGADGGPCLECSPGTWKNATGSVECSGCASNSFSAAASVVASACICNAAFTGPSGGPCQFCAAGKYKNSSGSELCRPCSPNSHSVAASASVLMCLCNKGFTGENGGTCVSCAQGTYKAVNASAACSTCPDNSYSPPASVAQTACTCNAGFTGPDGTLCLACDSGTYKIMTGTGTCANCPPESHSANASTQLSNCTCNAGWDTLHPTDGCMPCPRGTFKDSAGSHSCAACLQGSFLNVTTGTTCESCPANSISRPGRETCLCAAGWYGIPLASEAGGTQGEGCINCPIGAFKGNAGSHLCLDCPSGLYSNTTGATQCKTCPSTFTNPHDIALAQCRADLKFTCQSETLPHACFLAQYLPLPKSLESCSLFGGGLVRVTSRLPVAVGDDFSGDTRVPRTLPGEGYGEVIVDRRWGSLLKFALTLTGADEGFYWPGFVETEDELMREWCAVVAWSPNSSNTSIHRRGSAHWWTAQLPLNRHSPYASNTEDEILIPQGRLAAGPENGLRNYSSLCLNVSQRSICMLCGEGLFLDSKTQHCQVCGCGAGLNLAHACGGISDGCEPCPIGFSSYTDQNSCSACEAGKYSDVPGGPCNDCLPGYGSSTGSTSCFLCAKGYAGIGDGSGCEACSRGSWSQPGSSSCTLCAAGFTTDVASPAGPANCFACDLGSASNDPLMGCTPCRAGYHSWHSAALVCTPCASGYISLASRATSCSLCGPGNSSNTLTAGTRCVACAAGTYSSIGGEICHVCPPGSYSNISSSTSCHKCERGYSSFPPTTSCSVCQIGSAAGPHEGSPCLACRAGTFSSFVGAFNCSSCPAGTSSPYVGQTQNTTCVKCPPGTYCASKGCMQCVPCSSGYISTVFGSVVCDACAKTKYTPLEGPRMMWHFTGRNQQLDLPAQHVLLAGLISTEYNVPAHFVLLSVDLLVQPERTSNLTNANNSTTLLLPPPRTIVFASFGVAVAENNFSYVTKETIIKAVGSTIASAVSSLDQPPLTSKVNASNSTASESGANVMLGLKQMLVRNITLLALEPPFSVVSTSSSPLVLQAAIHIDDCRVCSDEFHVMAMRRALTTSRLRSALAAVGIVLEGEVVVATKEKEAEIETYEVAARILSVPSTPSATTSDRVLTQLRRVFASSSINLTSLLDAGREDRRYGSSCIDCAPGYWMGADRNCSACSYGTYKPSPGTHRCTLCTNGTYSLSSAAISLSSCQECGPGKYSLHFQAPRAVNVQGANCSMCPAGKYSTDAGSSSCALCAGGSAARDAAGVLVLGEGGAVSCTRCEVQAIGEISWRQPGIDCTWRCPRNNFKWKRDVFVETCVPCPPEAVQQDAVALAEGAATALDGTAYTCRCPVAYPLLRVLVYSDPKFMVPIPARAVCAQGGGWTDSRVPIPAPVVVSAKFEPLHSPMWCCNSTCFGRFGLPFPPLCERDATRESGCLCFCVCVRV